jgi:hypothetical protein
MEKKFPVKSLFNDCMFMCCLLLQFCLFSFLHILLSLISVRSIFHTSTFFQSCYLNPRNYLWYSKEDYNNIKGNMKPLINRIYIRDLIDQYILGIHFSTQRYLD